MTKLWAGRFGKKTDKAVERFTSSVSFDSRLWKYDIEGSIAHVKMLGKQTIISQKDARLIIRGLQEIAKEIKDGLFTFSEEHEDVHMNIEFALIQKIGPVGGKIHTARSRNDQVALDLRLYVREETSILLELINRLQNIVVTIAEKCIDIIMPGYTHLQRAQPVLLSHHLLAYYEMFARDAERLADVLKRVNVLPLGSAALAGTALPIDREFVAKLLKFPAISENSIDAVSDRDFAIEFVSVLSIMMTHLSRFSEEMILWNSDEFGFIELPDSIATGSSIMPQKKNPDVFELVRGKTGRVYGNLVAILTVMKGLPLAYNRDLQEDKPALFDTADTVRACLEIFNKVLPKIRFRKNALKKAADTGYQTATDIAEYLVRKGLPFRDAHEVTGEIVRYCIGNHKLPGQMHLKEFQRFSDLFERDISQHITTEVSVRSKKSHGGTSKDLVLARIKEIRKKR